MPAALRLMRIGKKGYPTYRIVLTDKRRKQNGYYRKVLGTYNPHTTPSTLKLNHELLNDWIRKGALISEGLKKLLKKGSSS